MDDGGSAWGTVQPGPDPATPSFEGFERPEEVGRGGFGIVYRAWQPTFMRYVAIKVPSAFSTDSRTLRAFEREAAAMGSLSDSPHVVVPYGADVLEDGTPILLLPWLDGGSLQDRINKGRLAWDEALAITIKLAGALEDAHAKGVLHLDVKPDNVLFTSRGEPQLADFGIARLEAIAHLHTESQAFTTLFAAPELLTDSAVSPLVDIYSLGATLYAAVNGTPAFFGRDTEPPFQVQRRVASDPLPPLGEEILPDAAWQVVKQAMAKLPADRYQSATQFRQALLAAQRTLGVEVTELGLAREQDQPLRSPNRAADDRPGPAPSTNEPQTPGLIPDVGPSGRGHETTRVRLGVPAVVAGFTGRDDTLAVLDRELNAAAAPAMLGLVGLGGSGKSQLAARYVRDHEHEVDVVLWAPAEIDPGPAFAEFGARLGLPGDDLPTRAKAAVAWLGETDRSWLLVLDNAPDLNVIRDWVPTTGPGRVIVTSRNHAVSELMAVAQVNAFGADTAADFLLERTRGADRPGAREVAEALGGLPLALSHAAAYCRSTNIGFASYLSLLDDLPAQEMFGENPAGAYEATVASTWGPSVDAAEAKVAGAAHLLDVAAHYAPDAIPLELLAPRSADALEMKRQLDRVGALVDLSLVSVDGDKRFLVHRLVQKVIRDTHDALVPQAAVEALDRIRAAWPDDTDVPDAWPACQALLPHLDQVAACVDHPGSHAEHLIQALNGASLWLHRASPNYVDHATRTAERAERLLGPDHPDTLFARDRLASALQWAGRNSEATPIFEGVLADSERLLGEDHIDTLGARANLAASYQAAGRTDEAIPIKERVVADYERLLGGDHSETLMVRANLALSYQTAGRTSEAIAIGEQLIADSERLLGSDHPDTLLARADLASSYRAAGRTGEAITMDEQVVVDCERVLGLDHPDTVTARADLASSYRAAGRVSEAVPILEQVVADRERLLGADHPSTLAARADLASSHEAAGPPTAPEPPL